MRNLFKDGDLEWMADHVAREGFWATVDSSPGFTLWNRKRWPEERDGEWCIAANSERNRCSKRATHETPFCPFHAERAMLAFLSLCLRDASRDADRWLGIDRKRAADHHRGLMLSQGYEHALAWDAAEAARRLNERVYFFAADHAVKIGRSIDPVKRVKTLGATKAPEDVDVRAGQLIGTIPGGCRVESDLHRRFGRHRLVGEWFALEPIQADIHALIADAAELDVAS